ncbi:hypothetical protein [Dactylosporangium matsuzakiense]|uniref:Uncharacterized protein n=1 Tax=Dactylosporangium matsuzakiense TaxID=53360 RepID=A0A9W6KVH6_9ACTN|nr:hypothetical protein [Dactylosporangium matsuzakiense]UWZ41714.1 hypothetical protein Dmats_29245 [Dactylosporangium matsuzakiense]GLL07341.1 hypothetical protein GCM10017581_090930 [Dactylosporangium matsuzakiense]
MSTQIDIVDNQRPSSRHAARIPAPEASVTAASPETAGASVRPNIAGSTTTMFAAAHACVIHGVAVVIG